MWYPPKVTTGADTIALTLAEVKAQCAILPAVVEFDAKLTALIKAGQNHAEKYCGQWFSERTVVVRCDDFCDFSRLSVAPVRGVTAIKYFDPAGVEQTLPNTVYRPELDGMDGSIVLKPGQVWPTKQGGTRISMTADVGYEAAGLPDAVKHALLLWVADSFLNRGNAEQAEWTAFDALLCNHVR